MIRRLVLFTCGLVALAAAPAAAQQTFDAAAAASAAPPQMMSGIGVVGFDGFVGADVVRMSASQTFNAVFGSSTLVGISGGAEVKNLFKGVFVRFGFSHFSKTGQRVYVYNNQVSDLGIPLTLTMTPIEISGGLRFGGHDANRKLTPYAGAGVIFSKLTQSSSFDQAGEGVNQSNTGFLVMGGVDFAVTRVVGARFEVQYRDLPNAIGQSGASQAFGETNLGGLAVRIAVTIGR